MPHQVRRLNKSPSTDKSQYLVAAFGEVHPGVPVPARYPGPAVGYVIEGEVYFEDLSKSGPDEVSKLVAGDINYVEEGTSNSFTTPTYAKVLGVSHVPTNHPEDFFTKE